MATDFQIFAIQFCWVYLISAYLATVNSTWPVLALSLSTCIALRTKEKLDGANCVLRAADAVL